MADATEIEAIKNFCTLEIEKKLKQTQLKEKVADLKDMAKRTREVLEGHMKQNKLECIAVSKDDSKRLAAKAAAAGLMQMPNYLRLLRANKDSGINSETIQEALQNLSAESLRETMTTYEQSAAAKPMTSSELLKQAILVNMRRLIRSYTSQLKLVPNGLRGSSLYDLPEASTDIADSMYVLWSTEQAIKAELAKEPKADTSDIKELKERIEGYFVRTGLTSQRVIVEGRAWKLARKVSIQKSKVGIGKFEQLLDEAIKTVDLESFNPDALIQVLQIQLSNLPPETKTSVGLTAIKQE